MGAGRGGVPLVGRRRRVRPAATDGPAAVRADQLAGDWPAARRYANECVDLVAQGAEAWRERAMLAIGRIHSLDGDLDAARAVAAPALALQEAAGDRWEAVIFSALLGS